MRITPFIIMAIAFVLFSDNGMAAIRPGEGIVRDPSTGDYLATYWDEDETGGEFVTARLVSATKIEPKVASLFKLSDAWQVSYSYTIANGTRAKQPIDTLRMYGLPEGVSMSNVVSGPIIDNGKSIKVELFDSALSSPINWIGSGTRNPGALSISWRYDNERYDVSLGIKPGASQSGFGFVSSDLPGILGLRIMGNAGYHHFAAPGMGEGPDPSKTDIPKQMSEIERNDYVSRDVSAPIIIVSVPFDAAMLLGSIRTHVATWPAKQLLDPVFASQLDRYLAAAADAYRLNNAKAGREHIETLRKMLAKEHHHLDHDDEDDDDTEERKAVTRFTIDRLAARVLDFDLRYVLKRTEHGGEKRKER
jgi:hypothetical protein